MIDLDAATTPRDGGLDVPEGWKQGRGAYGGLVIASLLRAIEAKLGDPERTLRSLTAELPAPVETGRAELSVEVLRRGNSVTTARAALVQSGEVRGHAVGIFATTRPASPGWNDLVPPEAPPWRSLEPQAFTAGFPEFTQHFEYRVVAGAPFSGGAPRAVGWIRPRLAARRDAAYLAAVIDAWFPAALVRWPAMRPMATIAYTLDVVGGLDGLDPDAPLLYRANVPVSADGYFVELRELWGSDGRLLALNHQTFAIIA